MRLKKLTYLVFRLKGLLYSNGKVQGHTAVIRVKSLFATPRYLGKGEEATYRPMGVAVLYYLFTG